MRNDGSAAALGDRRVAILSHSHPSLTKGGAEIAAHTLFTGLRAIGVDAILIACCDERRLGEIDLGPNEFALPYRGQWYDHFYQLAPSGVRRELLQLLLRERIDVLNAHHFLHTGITVFQDLAAAGIPVVFTIHEFLSICHNHGQMITRGAHILCEAPSPRACHACFPEHSRQQFAVRAHVVGQSLVSVAAFVSPSRFLADRMIDNGVAAERMHVIDNATAHPAAPAMVPGRRDATRMWRFGFFGQINLFKGVDTILDACALLARDADLARTVRITIHGNFVSQSDRFLERFDAAIADYPFLSYHGPYDNAQVGQLMAACDYVLTPSSWWENSPVVIQEAYRAGRPVICTGIGGMAEKVPDHVSGLHFARNDPGDLAQRIAEAADAALYEKLVAGIPAVATPAMMANDYVAVFAMALDRSRATA